MPLKLCAEDELLAKFVVASYEAKGRDVMSGEGESRGNEELHGSKCNIRGNWPCLCDKQDTPGEVHGL